MKLALIALNVLPATPAQDAVADPDFLVTQRLLAGAG